MSLDTFVEAIRVLGRETTSVIMAEVVHQMEVERSDYLTLVRERDAILDRHCDADVRPGDFLRIHDINTRTHEIAGEWGVDQKTDAALVSAIAAAGEGK